MSLRSYRVVMHKEDDQPRRLFKRKIDQISTNVSLNKPSDPFKKLKKEEDNKHNQSKITCFFRKNQYTNISFYFMFMNF